MIKTIPAGLWAHYQLPGTTLCNLLRIQLRDGTVAGLTNLDIDFPYDDGAGEVTYSSTIGMNTFPMETSAGVEVDNSEAMLLMPDSGPFSGVSIDAGVLDYGQYKVYRLNWADTSDGHDLVDAGTVGIAKQRDRIAAVLELRSRAQQLKMRYGRLDSLTCRWKFGSAGGGSGCSGILGCGFDAESLWQNHSVAAVGAEDDLSFTCNSTPAVNGPNGALSFAPGLVRWLTGNNAGRTSEVEIATDADITLWLPTERAIQVGDTFQIRPDCDFTWETCRDSYDNQDNFGGEPKIPVSDEGSQSIPNYSGIWTPSDTLEPETP